MLLLTAVLKDQEMPVRLFSSIIDVKAFLFDNPLSERDLPTDPILAAVRAFKVYYDWDNHKQGKPGWACQGFRVYSFVDRDVLAGRADSLVMSRVVG